MLDLSLDHLILGITDLSEGQKEFEEKTGISLQFGGKHPFGTHNALCSLENGLYLEVIAPQDVVNPATGVFSPGAGVDELRCFGWSLRTNSIDLLASKFSAAGIAHSAIGSGSRKTTEGNELRWKTLFLLKDGQPTLQPFFIEWEKDSLHPSMSTPMGCTLNSLDFSFNRDQILDSQFFPKDDRLQWLPGDAFNHGFFKQLRLNTPKGLITFN